MKYKTSELDGARLDAAVATALGYATIADIPIDVVGMECNPCGDLPLPWRPSRIWDQGGPIIEREKITLFHDAWWEAGTFAELSCSYGTPSLEMNFRVKADALLVAAMRCFVASKLGDEVDS